MAKRRDVLLGGAAIAAAPLLPKIGIAQAEVEAEVAVAETQAPALAALTAEDVFFAPQQFALACLQAILKKGYIREGAPPEEVAADRIAFTLNRFEKVHDLEQLFRKGMTIEDILRPEEEIADAALKEVAKSSDVFSNSLEITEMRYLDFRITLSVYFSKILEEFPVDETKPFDLCAQLCKMILDKNEIQSLGLSTCDPELIVQHLKTFGAVDSFSPEVWQYFIEHVAEVLPAADKAVLEEVGQRMMALYAPAAKPSRMDRERELQRETSHAEDEEPLRAPLSAVAEEAASEPAALAEKVLTSIADGAFQQSTPGLFGYHWLEQFCVTPDPAHPAFQLPGMVVEGVTAHHDAGVVAPCPTPEREK